LFNFIATDNALGEMKIHGTNVTVVSTPGLNNINAIYALRDANMFLGVDLENEEEEFKFWYSEDFDLVRFKYRFKMGVQVSQTQEIVKFTL
jgi:spore coat polysaccharide biosynthesis protein SpsF (cytidylyltransferase family)